MSIAVNPADGRELSRHPDMAVFGEETFGPVAEGATE
jgi:hypothetical protein